MAHILFALFDEPAHAKAAILELEEIGTPRHRCSVVLHQQTLDDVPSSELALFETSAARTAARGTILGGALGALLGGLVAGPFGLVGGGALVTALFFGGAGSVYGLLFGAIEGASEPDPTLKRFAKGLEEGKVLLSVDPPSEAAAEQAEKLLVAHKATVVHRRAIRAAA